MTGSRKHERGWSSLPRITVVLAILSPFALGVISSAAQTDTRVNILRWAAHTGSTNHANASIEQKEPRK